MPAEMPQAPALNLSDPSVEAASGFANAGSHAYAAGLQFATALRDQALRGQQQAQTKQHEQQQAQQQQSNEYAIETGKLREMGATAMPQYDSAVASTVGGTPGQPTLRRDQSGVQLDPGQQADDPNHIQIDSQGHAWHVPSLAERETAKTKPLAPLDDTNSLVPQGKLADALGAAGMKPGTRVPFEHASGLLGMMKAANGEPEEQDIDTKNFSAPVAIGRKTGKVMPIELPDGVTANPSTSKADSQVILPDQVGPNGELVVYDKNTQKVTLVAKPAGTKGQLNPAQQEVANRAAIMRQDLQDRRNQATQDRKDAKDAANQAKGQAAITDLQTKEQDAHERRSRFGPAVAAADGSEVLDPGDKNGQTTVTVTPALRARWKAEFDKATAQAQNYHEGQRKIVAANGGTPAPPLDLGQQPTPPPTGGQPTPPPATTPPPAGQPASQNPRKSYVKGSVYGGMTFLGGDPNNQQSWQKAQ